MSAYNLSVKPPISPIRDDLGIANNVVCWTISRVIEAEKSEAKNRVPGIVLIEGQRLSPYAIDALTETEQDWISQLTKDWEVELHSFSFRSAIDQQSSLKGSHITVEELIPLTLHPAYQRVVMAQQVYWSYTCCLRVVGLGRVRLVISFDNPQLAGNCTVFVTNRLDWSPRAVMTRWLELHASASFYSDRESLDIRKHTATLLTKG